MFDVAGFGDLSFDPRAYLFGFASVLSQAMYLLLVQKHADDIGAAESLHLNSYNTLPMLLICCIGSGELRVALHEFALSDVGMFLLFLHLSSTCVAVGKDLVICVWSS